ncbi:molybdopterin-guanine dinucleotide biosynthesis protein A [Sulfuricaulis limicola]|uniref:Molybdenum cofactor guanylyltransferase n=1 Tax=Sulfuricaulis limicola TaxID=1620215 RepID=A0A1B4XCK5_9GAMM|nr:molybdenum cofactor guanylyltransferase MobA [Sulfuricaulis limicola]BAV32557.1 molybdopterin-guanine dinucleotide biosynthesis protein A [Sulfuricaulis limicola]
MEIATRDITGVILAGGRGSRLGGADKGLVPLRGRPLVEYAIDALRPQVGALLISANRHRDIYASYGYPVIADVMGDYDGPLAGMLSAMRAAGTAYILTTPCDAPSIPADLARRLAEALVSNNAVASAVSLQGSLQPVFALLRCSLAGDLEKCLKQGERGAGEWLRRHHVVPVDFSGATGEFVNINTPQELLAQQHYG